ncbi:hypothetical protein LRS13_13610 [Svornostia abyssi]|uniref:DUF3817 domain-containing protein n=1 Tax=Svornostia abyssi TaxID=2898438 RepID=A0ABY5PBE1_9ACTN|nr:hypothetical protein LRS13_13610 [Parviterribacteraceae bacterium J379]
MRPSGSAEAGRLLHAIAVVAVVDAVLLAMLVAAAVNDAEAVMSVLGPVHGVGFLLEVALAWRGVGEGYWSWRFPAAIVVTLGPPGALWGHRRLRGRVQEAS